MLSMSPRHLKLRWENSNVKTPESCFNDAIGIVYKEYGPPGEIVNHTFNLVVLKRLRRIKEYMYVIT